MHARRLRRRAHRDELREFLIEGPVAVAEALGEHLPIKELFVAPDAPTELLDLATSGDVTVHRASEQVLEALSDAVTPQGVVAVAPMPDTSVDDLAGAELVLVLDGVGDPGNAGTLVRSARAAGAGGVIFGRGSVDPFGAKTVRASAGAILRTPIVRDAELVEVCARLRDHGFLVVGSDAVAGVSAFESDLAGRVALVLGSEAHGLQSELRDVLDGSVSVPMPGPVESLNVAVAGSILLFECVRQRTSEPK